MRKFFITAAAGWLLVTSHGGRIAEYPTLRECKEAVAIAKIVYDQSKNGQSITWVTGACVPDAAELNAIRTRGSL